MVYQAIDTASLGEYELKAWRGYYEEGCEAQRQRKIWTPRVRAHSNDLLYAVAVRDNAHLWLVLWVKRSTRGEYFVMFPRDEAGWDPHASYHRDGRHHHKSHDRKMIITPRQPPTVGFRGTEQMLTTPIELENVRAVKALCDPSQFTGVFEIPGGLLRQRGSGVAVDVTEANGPPLAQPWSEIVMQARFSDAVPEVLLTLWRQEPGGGT